MGLFNFGQPIVDPTQWVVSTISDVVKGKNWEDSIRGDYRRLNEQISVRWSEDEYYFEVLGLTLSVLKSSGEIARRRLGEFIDLMIIKNVTDNKILNPYIEYSKVKTSLLGSSQSVAATRCGSILVGFISRLFPETNDIEREYYRYLLTSYTNLCEEWIMWIKKAKLEKL